MEESHQSEWWRLKPWQLKQAKADLFLMWPLFIMRCPLILPLPSRPFALLTSLNHPQVNMIKLIVMTHFPIPTVADSVATFEFVCIRSVSAGQEFFLITFLDVIVASNVFGSDANARLFQKVEKHIFIPLCIFFWFAFSWRLQTCLAFTGADSLSVPFSDFGSVQIGRSVAFDTRSRVLVNHSRADIFISPRSKIYRLNFANKFWGNFRLNSNHPSIFNTSFKTSHQTIKPSF